jgi:hypothetical protein
MFILHQHFWGIGKYLLGKATRLNVGDLSVVSVNIEMA